MNDYVKIDSIPHEILLSCKNGNTEEDMYVFKPKTSNFLKVFTSTEVGINLNIRKADIKKYMVEDLKEYVGKKIIFSHNIYRNSFNKDYYRLLFYAISISEQEDYAILEKLSKDHELWCLKKEDFTDKDSNGEDKFQLMKDYSILSQLEKSNY